MIRHRYECRIETLPAVDRGVGEIVDALRQTGELDDTILVFSSDNGTFQGQHRLPGGKGLAYEEAAHMPLADPGAAEVRRRPRDRRRASTMTANIDYAPTFVDWAGSQSCPEVGDCRVMDGRSWLPLFDPKEGVVPGRPPAGDRALPEQRLGAAGPRDLVRVSGRARPPLPVRAPHVASRPAPPGQCEPSDVRELYDHVKDPFELQNLLPAAPGSPASSSSTRLASSPTSSHDCAGIEGRDPEPASGQYCR